MNRLCSQKPCLCRKPYYYKLGFRCILVFIFFYLYSFSVSANNNLEIGNVDGSGLHIEQGNKPGDPHNGKNKIKTGDIQESQVAIKQGDQALLEKNTSISADNNVEIGNVDHSVLHIEQGNKSGDPHNGNNKIKTEDAPESQVAIKQGDQASLEKDTSLSLWEEFSKAIITGAVGLFFALLLWWIKRKMGENSYG